MRYTVLTQVCDFRTFRDQPLVPFFVLFADVIQDPQSEESAHDLRLMFLATDVLRHIQRSDWPHSYTAQLLLVTSSCCQAATTIIRKATTHTTSSTHSRIGTLASSANSDSASGKGDTDAFARTLWTGLVESPILASAPDLSTVSESWNLDFTNPVDPAVKAMDQELSSADPGLGMNPYQFAAKFGPVDDGEVEELDENELNVVDNFRRGASLESVSDERGETAGQTTSASLLTQVIERGHQAATAFDDGAKRHLNWAQTLFYEAEVAFEEADERFKEAQMQRQNALDHVEELRPSLERLEARYLDALNRLIPRE